MKQKTKDLLHWAWFYCDEEDKSTEFMIQFMQDTADVDHDCVMNFIMTKGDEREAWAKGGGFERAEKLLNEKING